DTQLGLDLRNSATTRNLETSPFAPSTDKNSAKTTAATASVSATSGSAYYAPATNVTPQPGANATATAQKRSSKSLLLICVALVAVAAVMALVFQRYGGKAQSNIVGSSGAVGAGKAKTIDPSMVPEGMVLIPEGSFMMGRDLTDKEKELTIKV